MSQTHILKKNQHVESCSCFVCSLITAYGNLVILPGKNLLPETEGTLLHLVEDKLRSPEWCSFSALSVFVYPFAFQMFL